MGDCVSGSDSVNDRVALGGIDVDAVRVNDALLLPEGDIVEDMEREAVRVRDVVGDCDCEREEDRDTDVDSVSDKETEIK